MGFSTAKYEDFMNRSFYSLGLAIGKHPWRFIYSLLLFTAVCSLGFLRFHQQNNARITFTDAQSPSHIEARVLENFLQQNGTLNMIEVLVEAKDDGSLLRSGYREQVWDLVEEISTKIKVKDSSGRELTYLEMCEPYCGKNDAFITLLKLYNQNYSRIDITYPTMDILGKQVFIAGNIYGVHLANGSNSVEGFDTVVLRYYMVYPETKPLYDWEAKMVHLLYDSGKYDLLKSGAASDSLVAQEVKEMGEKSAPLLSIALAVLMAFLMICSFRSKRRESKPLEALLGGATPLLAGVTTVGVVSATGLAFQSIVVSTLFLLLAIGIDDVFIMLAAWHRTERELDIPQRVAQMVKVSGCSMTVTSITNIISFGNGVFSSTPVLQTFAIYSVVASMICYLYQLILFPAILTLTAHKEYEKSDEDKSCLPEELKCIKKAGEFHDRAWKTLARLVGKPWLRALMIVVLLVYWTFTYYGISTVETDLSVQKLAPKEARIVIFKERYDEVIKGMQTVAIVVTTPGDLRDPEVFADVNNTIRDYETASYSYGSESTFCFLKPYMEFLEFHEGGEEDEEIPFTYKHIPAFIKSDGYWKATMRINETACALDEPECLTSFLFTTGFTTLASYNEMFPLIEEWRAIARKHPALGVYAYSERSTYADQTDALGSVIWQTLYSEVFCMGLSFIVFIPDIISIIAGMFSLLSVNLGVFGFLSLWGVGIDPVSMAALLMSIGFSVDISAHISYHYYQVKAPTPREKLEDAFLNIGWPTMQGALSTFIAMTPILIRPSYLGMVFLKTVALVTVFGLIHGLVILPILLSALTSVRQRCSRSTVAPSGYDGSDGSDSGSSTSSIQPHRISVKSTSAYKADP